MFPLTKSIGEFIAGMRYEAIPSEALPMIRNGFTDYAGVVILGRETPIARLMKSISSVAAEGGEARVCFSGQGAPAGQAALINGAAGHALDYDDIGLAAHPAHPTVVLASAILAEGEVLGKSGADMMSAYVTGYEVWGELAIRDEVPHHIKGWHPTGTFGAIAAGAACARLRGLNAETAAHAIGIAASQAAGLVANYGSMTKPFHAARAAQSGLLAARLAAAGMTASADAIESPKGFLKAVSPEGRVDLDTPPAWGETWWILRHGLGFKLYPVCYGAHRAIDGMLEILAETPFQAQEVERVILRMGEKQVVSLVNHDPQTGLDGKFSGEFAMAMTIIAGRATLAEVTDEFVQRADVRALLKKVRIETDPARDFKAPGEQPNDRLIVELTDGRRIEKRLGHPRGHPTRPLGADQLWVKFADCVGDAMPPARVRALFDRLQALDQLGSLADLPLIETQTRLVTEEKAPAPPADAAQPLAGITVVELGHSVAAPFAGQTLADLGARVIKVEKPGSGDDARQWGPPFWHGAATVFQSLNRNKFSVAVDLKDADERARLKRFMVDETDVVLQNMRPGLVGKMGLGAELRTENPRLIYCNMAAFGASGPLSTRPGYDPLMQAFGGVMSITGEEGRPPVRVGPSMIDMATGMWAVIGILAALHRRDLTGQGCAVDTSLFETTLTWIGTQATAYLATGEVPKRRGSENASLAPYKVYEASDGYILIAAGNDNLFRRLAAALGHAEWARDERYATNPQRVRNREAVNEMVQNVVAGQPSAHWVAVLDAADVPCAPLQSIDQVLAHPQTKALGILQDTPDGTMSLMGLPLSFDGHRPPLRQSPPSLGAHSHIVLGPEDNQADDADN